MKFLTFHTVLIACVLSCGSARVQGTLRDFHAIARHYDIMPTYVVTPENVLAEVCTIYQEAAQDSYIGEGISQTEHALQAALQVLYMYDEHTGIDEDVVIAALFHDIGHRYTGKHAATMDGFGVVDHDTIGAAFLAVRGFSEKVVALVAGHVDAKRYRVSKDKAYYDQLTYASQQTLIRQGGPMSEAEAVAFESNPYFTHILLLRSCEEKAKAVGASTPPLAFYKGMIVRHLQQRKNDR